MKACLFISHGSRSEKSKSENERMVAELKQATSIPIFVLSFLDVLQPDISEGIKNCIDQGATEIIVLQHFLNSGNHVLKDIPHIIQQAQQKYPQVTFKIQIPVGLDQSIQSIYLNQIKNTL